jgi:hypothetical protein
MRQGVLRIMGGLIAVSALGLGLYAAAPAEANPAAGRAHAVPAVETIKATRPMSCGGSAYVEIGLKSNGSPVVMKTGFKINEASTSFFWEVSITGGRHYGYDYKHHGPPLRAHQAWNGGHTSAENPPHGHYAAVVAPGSYVQLRNGTHCTVVGILSAHGHL